MAALALRLSAGTARYQIMALDLLGDLVAELGEHERALDLREQSLRLARNVGNAFWLPRQQANLALARLAVGDAGGGPLLGEALGLARRREQGFHATRCLESLAALEIFRGAYAEAVAYADQLMELVRLDGMAEHEALARFWRGRALVGSPTTGRGRAELAPVVGYFVNPVVLRLDLAGAPTFAELLRRPERSGGRTYWPMRTTHWRGYVPPRVEPRRPKGTTALPTPHHC